MKKLSEQKLREMIRRNLLNSIQEDAEEEMERAQFQAYNDMYLVPQSNWKLKREDIDMYDANGNLRRGKIGEIHKLSKIEYDMMHTGEVMTECNGETYTIDSREFTEAFEKVVDENELKVNNEGINKTPKKEKKKLTKEQKEIKQLQFARSLYDEYIILDKKQAEDLKKLSKIKKYYGKNIREAIENLEKSFIKEWEYEESDGQMHDQDDEIDSNRNWQPVFANYYFDDYFSEDDLFNLIENDDENVIMVSKDKNNPDSLIISYKKLKITVNKKEFNDAIHYGTANDLIEYDSEGTDSFFSLTEKGNQYAEQKKYDITDTLKKIKKITK